MVANFDLPGGHCIDSPSHWFSPGHLGCFSASKRRTKTPPMMNEQQENSRSKMETDFSHFRNKGMLRETINNNLAHPWHLRCFNDKGTRHVSSQKHLRSMIASNETLHNHNGWGQLAIHLGLSQYQVINHVITTKDLWLQSSSFTLKCFLNILAAQKKLPRDTRTKSMIWG